MKTHRTFFAVLVILTLLFSCKRNNIDHYEYTVPEYSNDGWDVASLNDVGINSVRICEMMDFINENSGHNIHSILIFKNNKLVFEEYFEGYLYSSNPPGTNGEFIQYDEHTDHYLASVSKSITSVILGAAVKEDYIDNLEDKIIDLLPEYSDILTGEKADITLKHLLTMTSGLDWDESSSSYGNPNNDVTALFNSEDPVEYILSRPLLYTPGSEFLYNSGNTNVIGAIIQKKTEMSLLDFGNEYLFNPLTIDGGTWQVLPGGYFFASGGISLRPRGLAKIGSLFLNDGRWDNKQVITEEWISESVMSHIDTEGRTLPSSHSYGYQWWIQDFSSNGIVYNSFLAAGWGDQYMIIFEERDMMVLINCGNYLSSGSISIMSLVEDFILDAL